MKHERELCKKIASLLSEYLDQELDPTSCKEVIEHMKDCSPCLEFVESLRTSIELTRNAGRRTEDIRPLPEEVRTKLRNLYETFRTKRT